MNPSLPEGIILTWYGDDFTGAAAVMEVLTFAGLPAMLFFDVPNEAQLAKFPDIRAVGVASTARTQSPEWMDNHLPSVFSALSKLSDSIVHYKVCTTLDSAPTIGSIGKAIEIGSKQLNSSCVPVLIAAPQMQRFQFFGHLFTSMGDDVYRLDRHPVMSTHPVTPVSESDVAAHIQKQTNHASMQCLNLETIKKTNQSLTSIRENFKEPLVGLTIDSIDPQSETAAGALLWEAKRDCKFVVGSQGVEYALIRHWQDQGMLQVVPPAEGIGSTYQIAVVSGSVSRITEEQINWSRDNGFACIKFDVLAALDNAQSISNEIDRTVAIAIDKISAKQSPLIYTAKGPDDLIINAFNAQIARDNLNAQQINQKLGESLGQVLRLIINQTNISRAVISGGDTSGFAAQQLGIFALSALAPTIPGAAIFKAHAEGEMDGLELALKGGQMGSPDYFGWVRDGGGPR